MANTIVEFVALFALVWYPAIPIVICLAHWGLKFWQRLGVKSYLVFLLLFGVLDFIMLLLVLQWKERLVAWRLYDSPVALVGLLLIAAGMVLGVMSVRSLTWRTLVGIPEIVPERRGALATRGIYSYLRHPRYLEFILEVFGIAILSGFLINFILALYFLPAIFLAAHLEEKELIERFSEEYLEYKKKSRWFW